MKEQNEMSERNKGTKTYLYVNHLVNNYITKTYTKTT